MAHDGGPRLEINYLTNAESFANTALVSTLLIERVAEVALGQSQVKMEDLLALSVFCETVVLSARIVPEDGFVLSRDVEGKYSYDGADRILTLLEQESDAIDSKSAASDLYYEAGMLASPIESVEIVAVHGSHLIVYDAPQARVLGPSFAGQDVYEPLFNTEYKRLLDAHGHEIPSTSQRRADMDFDPPWALLADCHGIPYVRDALYSIQSGGLPTNIGVELYHRLEELNGPFFERMRQYLGPTYVRIPSVLGMVFKECDSRDDIPIAVARVRDRLSQLNKSCTRLEVELRTATTLAEQARILKAIDDAYDAVARKAAMTTTRISHRLFDIVKQIDPVRMGRAALDLAKLYDVEKQSMIKVPGLYNLWKAMLDVEQALPQMTRVFGRDLSPKVLLEFGEMLKTKTRTGA